MCGVIAVVGQRSSDKVNRGLSRLAHRGIRSRVEYLSDRAALGHTRLPIVGLGEENDQPVLRSNSALAFVGEILNFKDINPDDDCDLPLVTGTWHTQGPAGFSRFDGFWSVVEVDTSGRIRALVDYLAQKPLYVRHDSHATAVASEPDAVACLGPVILDEVYLSAVVKWGYCPEPWRTPYLGVRKMMAGELLTIAPGQDPSYKVVDPLKPLPLNQRQLREEIQEAVQRRVCSSDVPVACLVSGGLDSAIVWLLARQCGTVHAYHVENDPDETELFELVAPGATSLGYGDIGLKSALDYMQEPVDLGSLLPQAALSDAIARADGERVCLTGDGADEFFGGYGRSQRYDSQASDVAHELACWHLPRLDRVMMRNRIEVRSPFLARRVAGTALSLSRNQRTSKKILKELFSELVPARILAAPKRPLRTPAIERDRESNSARLVDLFRARTQKLFQEG